MLLEDPVPAIRSQTVLGVFHVMSLYWELMPTITIKNIVTKVIQDLAFDSSSADVRESVVKVRGHSSITTYIGCFSVGLFRGGGEVLILGPGCVSVELFRGGGGS
jgi:hypothetical protein